MGKKATSEATPSKHPKIVSDAPASGKSQVHAKVEAANESNGPAKAIPKSDSKSKPPVAQPPAFTTLSEFLHGSKHLGSAKPIPPDEKPEDDSDENSEYSDDEDERLLTMRVLQAEEEDGPDWVGRYAPDSDEDDDFDEDDFDDDDDEDDDEDEGSGEGTDDEHPSKDIDDVDRKHTTNVMHKTPAAKPSSKADSKQVSKAQEPRIRIEKTEKFSQTASQSAASKSSKQTPVVKSDPISQPAKTAPAASKRAGDKSTAVHPGGSEGTRITHGSSALVAKPADMNAGKQAKAHAVVISEPAPVSGVKRPRPAALEVPANTKVAEPLEKARNPLPKAFVPANEQACVWIGNLPRSIDPKKLRETLGKYGAVKNVHLECNNNGKPVGFGYVEFADKKAATKALAEPIATKDAADFEGREMKVAAYSAETNYRNPDGTRRGSKEKQARKAEKLAAKRARKAEEHSRAGAGGGFKRFSSPGKFGHKNAHTRDRRSS